MTQEYSSNAYDQGQQKFNLNQVFLQDLFCGSLAGMANLLTGHPLDIIKVRMQVDPHSTFTQTIRHLYKYEGMLGFTKGLSPPLLTVPLINSIVFSAYEFSKRMMGVAPGQECTLSQSVKAGMFAGFVNSFVLSPIELVKCRLQIQKECHLTAYYKGPLDCLQKIVREEGTCGPFKGLVSTVLVEVPSYIGQFGGYYLTKKFIAQIQGCEMQDLGLFSKFIAGGVGGFTCWLVSYPQDVIKTRLQVSREQQFKKYHPLVLDGGFINCAKHIYESEGRSFRGFWRGFLACSMRAIVSNAFMFLAYEWVQKQLSNSNLE